MLSDVAVELFLSLLDDYDIETVILEETRDSDSLFDRFIVKKNDSINDVCR